jgi:hypothetical protein
MFASSPISIIKANLQRCAMRRFCKQGEIDLADLSHLVRLA